MRGSESWGGGIPAVRDHVQGALGVFVNEILGIGDVAAFMGHGSIEIRPAETGPYDDCLGCLNLIRIVWVKAHVVRGFAVLSFARISIFESNTVVLSGIAICLCSSYDIRVLRFQIELARFFKFFVFLGITLFAVGAHIHSRWIG